MHRVHVRLAAILLLCLPLQGVVMYKEPAAGGGGVTLTDDFDRANNADISVSAPFSWTELSGQAQCVWAIDTNTLEMTNQGGACDSANSQVRADSDLDTVDHWVLFQYNANNSMPTGSGYGAVLRTQSGAGLGAHYQARCGQLACTDIRVERMTSSTGFGEAVTNTTECDGTGDSWSGLAVGDYFGVSIEGTDSSTVFKLYDFGASDPGNDYSTWGAATCTPALIPPATYVDTGTRVGIRIRTPSGSSNGDYIRFDDFDGGDI